MGLLCCWSRELMYLATGLIGILVWHLIKQIKLLTTLPPGRLNLQDEDLFNFFHCLYLHTTNINRTLGTSKNWATDLPE